MNCNAARSMGRTQRTVLAVFAVGLALGGLGAGGAAADPTVSIQPSDIFIQPGQSTVFQIWVDDSGDPISCFIVQIHFDPAVIQISGVTEGLLYQVPEPTFPDWELVAPDTLQISNCILGSGTFVLGPGPLANVAIEALAVGTSPVEFTFAQVRDIDRIPYGDPGSEDGQVFVLDPAGVGEADGGDAGSGEALPPAAAAGARLRVTPNPASGPVRIELVAGPPGLGEGGVAGGGVEGSRVAGSPLRLERIDIDIYDVRGRLRRTLHGTRTSTVLRWDGRDAGGQPLPAGLYVIRARGAWRTGAKLLFVR